MGKKHRSSNRKSTPPQQEDTRFDTMRLIRNVSKEEMSEFALDDIMREFAPAAEPRLGMVAPLIPANQKVEQTASGEELLKEIREESFEAISEAIPVDTEGAIVDQIQQAINQELNRIPEMTAPDSVIQLVQEEKTVQKVAEPERKEPRRAQNVRTAAKPEPKKAEEPPKAKKPEEKTVQKPTTKVPAEEPVKVQKEESVKEPVEEPVQMPADESAQDDAPVTTEEAVMRARKKQKQPKKQPEKPGEEKTSGSAKEPKQPKAPKQPKEPKPPKLKVLKEPKPEPVPNAGLTFKKYTKAIRPAQNKGKAVLFLLLVSVVLTLINDMHLSTSQFLSNNQLLSKILLGIMVLCALLSLDTLKSGIKGIITLRFTANSLVVLTFLITAVDAILCTTDATLPFCAVVCLQFWYAGWGNTLRLVSVRRSLKALMKPQEEPQAVGTMENIWKNNSAAVIGGNVNVDEHVRGLLGPNLTDRWMGIYVPVILVLSLILSVVVRVQGGNSLTWAWSSMLICSMPVGLLIGYYHPFAVLSGRLMKEGAAVSGWTGAEKLANAKGILVKDVDVFPTECVTLNGMKLYSSTYNVGQVTGYAAAVMEASESGLTPLFQELRKTNSGRLFTVDQFRIYEGGGYGAEVGGDVVLLGSLRFMQLMGVYMREGVKLRNAVYLAVNKEMCAVFALNYAPAGRVRKSMRRIEEVSHLSPVFATRDFLITPALVHERYKIDPDRLEFPGVEDRNRLFNISQVPPVRQGAVMTKSGFSTFAAVVTGSKILRTVTRFNTIVGMIIGVLSVGLMFFLTYLGAQAVNAVNVLLFTILWLIPVLINAGWVKRY